MKKFDEIEINGEVKSVSFTRPTYRNKMDYLKSVLPLQKDATTFQKEVEAGEVKDCEKGVKIIDTLNKARWEILFSLHKDKDVFKTENDFQDVADRDLDKLYTWLESEMGLKQTEEQEAFLFNSEKQQK